MRVKSSPPGAAPRLPRVLDSAELPEGVCLRLAVPDDLAWFAGHFPEDPILPGVAQLGWAIHFAREHFGFAADPEIIDRVKFLHSARPGVQLELELTHTGGHVSWQLREADTLLSRGHLEFADA